jgi:hypothetical protein
MKRFKGSPKESYIEASLKGPLLAILLLSLLVLLMSWYLPLNPEDEHSPKGQLLFIGE